MSEATRPVEAVPPQETGLAERTARVWPARKARGWRHALLRRLLVCADLAAALLASLSLAFGGQGQSEDLAWAVAVLPVWIGVAQLLGLYDRDHRILQRRTVDEIPQIVLWSAVGTACLFLILAVTPTGRPGVSSALQVGAVAVLAAFVLRALARVVFQRTTAPERVAFLGSAANAIAVGQRLALHRSLNIAVVGEWLDLDVERAGGSDVLRAVDRVVFAPDTLDDDRVREVFLACHKAGVTLSVIPPFPSTLGMAVELDRLADVPALTYGAAGPSRATLVAKRSLDVALGVSGLIVLAPVLVAVALAIKLDSRGPVLFRQERVGRGERRFRIFKFRTMVADAEARLAEVVHLNRHATTDPRMFKIVDDPRVTRVGRVLRRLSLDELPQLLNVVRGDMSLVGPRPLIVDEDQYVTGWARLRSTVRPGITGLWQVHGASELTFSEMVRLDCEYVFGLSARRDLRLILRTIPALLGRRAR